MKNLLVLLVAFWNEGHGVTGGDQILLQVLKRLRPQFATVWCFTSLEGQAIFGTEVPRLTVRTPPRWLSTQHLLWSYLLRTLWACVAVFRARADTIYAGSDVLPDVLPAALYARTHQRVRWVQAVFHLLPDWRSRPGSRTATILASWAQRCSLHLARRANEIVVLNEGVRAELSERGFHQPITVQPGGSDLLDKAVATVRVLPPPHEGVFLGRLTPSKGIFDLPKIWRAVVDVLPGARLAIIGSGSDDTRQNLHVSIEASGLSRQVAVFGFLPDAEVLALLRTSCVFLSPSHEEGFGMAIAEAMACGVPVVAWDLPVYEGVYGDHLVRVRLGDVPAFAAAVLSLLKNPGDRERRARAARTFVRRYSWDAVAAGYGRVLGAPL